MSLNFSKVIYWAILTVKHSLKPMVSETEKLMAIEMMKEI